MSARSAARVTRPTAAVRAVSGVLAGGLVALALFIGVVAALASWRSVAGPTATMAVIHTGVAVLAVLVQAIGDRRGRSGAVLAAAVVLTLTAGLLWTQWWV